MGLHPVRDDRQRRAACRSGRLNTLTSAWSQRGCGLPIQFARISRSFRSMIHLRFSVVNIGFYSVSYCI